MSPFSSVLLIVSGIIMIYFFSRARKQVKDRTMGGALENEMLMAANIARSAARDAFGVELEAADGSVEQLDILIEREWPGISSPILTDQREAQSIGEMAPVDTDAEGLDVKDGEEEEEESESIFAEEAAVSDGEFALSAFVGTLLTQLHGGVWQFDKSTHTMPYVYFKNADLALSPFDLIHRKLANPTRFDLQESYRKLLMELDLRSNQPRRKLETVHEIERPVGSKGDHTLPENSIVSEGASLDVLPSEVKTSDVISSESSVETSSDPSSESGPTTSDAPKTN